MSMFVRLCPLVSTCLSDGLNAQAEIEWRCLVCCLTLSALALFRVKLFHSPLFVFFSLFSWILDSSRVDLVIHVVCVGFVCMILGWCNCVLCIDAVAYQP
jgi:hypothetical protein